MPKLSPSKLTHTFLSIFFGLWVVLLLPNICSALQQKKNDFKPRSEDELIDYSNKVTNKSPEYVTAEWMREEGVLKMFQPVMHPQFEYETQRYLILEGYNLQQPSSGIKNNPQGAAGKNTDIYGKNLQLLIDDLNRRGREMDAKARSKSVTSEQLSARLSSMENSVGKEDPSLMETLEDLALLVAKDGDSEKALLYWRRACQLRRKHSGLDSEETIRNLEFLANNLFFNDGMDEARKLYAEAMSLKEKQFGPQDKRTLDTVAYLGSMLFMQRDEKSALPLLIRFAENSKSMEPAFHISGLARLAVAYISLHNYESARPLIQEGLAFWQNRDSSEHAKFQEALKALDRLEASAGNRHRQPSNAGIIEDNTTASEDTPMGINVIDMLIVLENMSKTAGAKDYKKLFSQFSNLNDVLLTSLQATTGPERRAMLFDQVPAIMSKLLSFCRKEPCLSMGYNFAARWKGLFSYSLRPDPQFSSPGGIISENNLQDAADVFKEIASDYRSGKTKVSDETIQKLGKAIADSMNRRYRDLKYEDDREDPEESADDTITDSESESVVADDGNSSLEENPPIAENIGNVAASEDHKAQTFLSDLPIRGLLQPDEVLIDLYRYSMDEGSAGGRSRLYAAVLTGRGFGPKIVELGKASDIDSAIDSWLREVTAGARAAKETNLLIDLLWHPLDAELAGNIKKIFISPDSE